MKFDFPFLCSECFRNQIHLDCLENLMYVDSLDVVKALDSQAHGGCVKLQCLLRHLAREADLRAHRALDDCYALRSVVGTIAASFGASASLLLKPFVAELDSNATLLNLSLL